MAILVYDSAEKALSIYSAVPWDAKTRPSSLTCASRCCRFVLVDQPTTRRPRLGTPLSLAIGWSGTVACSAALSWSTAAMVKHVAVQH